jgi:signal transduction histidine kinase
MPDGGSTHSRQIAGTRGAIIRASRTPSGSSPEPGALVMGHHLRRTCIVAVLHRSIEPSPGAPERSAVVAGGSLPRMARRRPGVMGRLVTRVLRAPLAIKLLGANLLIAAAAIATSISIETRDGAHPELVWVLAGAMALALVGNVYLVTIALRPVRSLIEAAERVRGGALETRVPPSRIADRELVRLGHTLNSLLDELGAERARLRELAAVVISAADTERERIARELHDSTAQRVAALVLHLGAVLNDGSNNHLRTRLTPAKELADEVLEELRTLAHVMHPRVLNDLGLPHALNALARETSTAGCLVEADVDRLPTRLPIEVESVFYRVAQEAVSNALRHGRPTLVRLELRQEPDAVRLVVTDDGQGFDTTAPARGREGLGTFTMRERVALVDGSLEIISRPGAGTRVQARVPVRRRAA